MTCRTNIVDSETLQSSRSTAATFSRGPLMKRVFLFVFRPILHEHFFFSFKVSSTIKGLCFFFLIKTVSHRSA